MAEAPFSVLVLVLMVGMSTVLAQNRTSHKTRSLITELGATLFEHVSLPCDPKVVGSEAACLDASIPTAGNKDYRMTDPKVAKPQDGSPWGKRPCLVCVKGRLYMT